MSWILCFSRGIANLTQPSSPTQNGKQRAGAFIGSALQGHCNHHYFSCLGRMELTTPFHHTYNSKTHVWGILLTQKQLPSTNNTYSLSSRICCENLIAPVHMYISSLRIHNSYYEGDSNDHYPWWLKHKVLLMHCPWSVTFWFSSEILHLVRHTNEILVSLIWPKRTNFIGM